MNKKSVHEVENILKVVSTAKRCIAYKNAASFGSIARADI
jgi:hypothetical protein